MNTAHGLPPILAHTLHSGTSIAQLLFTYIAQWHKYCTVTFYLEQHIAQWLLLGVKTSTSNPFLCAADFVNTNAHKQ